MCLMCLLLATLPSMGLFWFFLMINSRWKCDKLINYLVEVWLLVVFSVIRPTVFQYGRQRSEAMLNRDVFCGFCWRATEGQTILFSPDPYCSTAQIFSSVSRAASSGCSRKFFTSLINVAQSSVLTFSITSATEGQTMVPLLMKRADHDRDSLFLCRGSRTLDVAIPMLDDFATALPKGLARTC